MLTDREMVCYGNAKCIVIAMARLIPGRRDGLVSLVLMLTLTGDDNFRRLID